MWGAKSTAADIWEALRRRKPLVVSVLCNSRQSVLLGNRSVGRSTALGSLTERGALPAATKARIRQPGSAPGAWMSHRGDTSGGKGLPLDEGSTGQRLASPWFGSSTVILPKPVERRTPSRLWTVVSCSCRKPPRVRRVVRCHTWGWSRMAIVRLLLRELEGSGTVVVVAVEPLVGGVGLRVGGWESKPSNRSTQ